MLFANSICFICLIEPGPVASRARLRSAAIAIRTLSAMMASRTNDYSFAIASRAMSRSIAGRAYYFIIIIAIVASLRTCSSAALTIESTPSMASIAVSGTMTPSATFAIYLTGSVAHITILFSGSIAIVASYYSGAITVGATDGAFSATYITFFTS